MKPLYRSASGRCQRRPSTGNPSFLRGFSLGFPKTMNANHSWEKACEGNHNVRPFVFSFFFLGKICSPLAFYVHQNVVCSSTKVSMPFFISSCKVHNCEGSHHEWWKMTPPSGWAVSQCQSCEDDDVPLSPLLSTLPDFCFKELHLEG